MISILITTSDDKAGGIERALHDQLALLTDVPHLEIAILCPHSAFYHHVQETKHQLYHLSKARKLAFRHIPSLSGLGFAKKFDIALCHNGFMASGLKRIATIVIGICHNDKPHHFTFCDHLVCLTEKGRKKAHHANWPDDKITVIPHYHHINKTPDITIKKGALHIGAAGRMVAKKNLALFIEIACLVKQTHPQCQFSLGGTGPLYNEIAAFNQAKGNPVHLRGWTDFTPFLQSLDLFIIPSLDEPFGYVFPEAMAQGLGLLATPTFGADHCLDSGKVAPIIDAKSPQDFAHEICRLADDPAALYDLQQACFAQVSSSLFASETAKTSWLALLHHHHGIKN